MSQLFLPRRTLLSSLIASCAVLAACGGGSTNVASSNDAAVPASSAAGPESSTLTAQPASSNGATTDTSSQDAIPASAAIEQIQDTNAALATAATTPSSTSTSTSPTTTSSATGTTATPAATVDPSSATASALSIAPASPYVAVQDGHFYKDGKRLRIWGINLSIVGLQSYSEIDNMVSRLKAQGFNGVRLWPSDTTFYVVGTDGTRQWAPSTKGDGSELDRFDYLVSKLSAAGFAVQMTALHAFGKPSLKYSTSTEIRNWANATSDSGLLIKVLNYAPYLSTPYRNMMKSHYAALLKRTNPYTGRSYGNEPAISTWELANESRFVECSLEPSCLQGMPAIVSQQLNAAWMASSKWNPSGASLPTDLSTLINSTSYPAYAQFVSETFVNVSTELRSVARSYGSGVAVQPFLFNTGPGAPNAVAHYSYSRGDGFAMGAYRSPMAATVTGGYESSPWLPVSMGGKAPSLIEAFKVKDKPFVIYETSFFRPYPYRAEWGTVFAAMALRQDWDAVFLYHGGVPVNIYSNGGVNSGYGTKPLPDPLPLAMNYTFGFQHAGDPATMAGWALGGKLFQSVQEAPATATLWRLPVANIFASPKNYGYPGPYLGTISNARNATTAITFSPDSDTSCQPCNYAVAAPTTFSVNWSPSTQTLRVSTPGGSAISGLLSGDLGSLTSSISAHMNTGGFGVVGALNTNLRDPKTAGQTLFMISKVENYQKVFDANAVNLSLPYGAQSGVVNAGTLPLVYSGPSVTFSSASTLGFTPYAFSLATQAGAGKATSFSIPANKGTFFATVTP